MKYLFVLMLSLFSFQLMAQAGAGYGKALAANSEMKAADIISKVRQTITLSDEQATDLALSTGYYWDDLAALAGQKKYEERKEALYIRYTNDLIRILKSQEAYEAYLRKFQDLLYSQSAGHGRRR